MIVISACLCGVNCRYDGENSVKKKALALLKRGKAIPLCPEQLGGLTTPRDPNEIIGGDGSEVLDGKAKVANSKGEDSTYNFISGAYEALKIAKAVGAEYAILKGKSPSCGKGKIYDGSFSGRKIEGNGITAELFMRNGIKVYTEEEIFEEQ